MKLIYIAVGLAFVVLCLSVAYYLVFYLPGQKQNDLALKEQQRLEDRLEKDKEIVTKECVDYRTQNRTKLVDGIQAGNELVAARMASEAQIQTLNQIKYALSLVDSPQYMTNCVTSKLKERGYNQ